MIDAPPTAVMASLREIIEVPMHVLWHANGLLLAHAKGAGTLNSISVNDSGMDEQDYEEEHSHQRRPAAALMTSQQEGDCLLVEFVRGQQACRRTCAKSWL